MAGLASAGVDVLLLGVLPTPGVAYLTGSLGADLGVMLSASHNAMPDNGIKFLARGGVKLDDAIEAAIERRMHEHWERPDRRRGRPGQRAPHRGRRVRRPPRRHDLALAEGLTVVLDCAEGAAYEAGPRALREAGATVIPIHASPTGSTSTTAAARPTSSRCAAAVVEHGADAGFALDGDADRCLAVDHEGNVVDGDQILAVLALALAESGHLAKDTVVATVMSNLGFVQAMKAAGVGVRQTKVGDRYVLEAMKVSGYSLGGEQSGHVIMSEYATTGDGILTALHVLERMAGDRAEPAVAGLGRDPAAAGAGQRAERRQGARRRGRRPRRGGGRGGGGAGRRRPGPAASLGHRAAGAGDGRGPHPAEAQAVADRLADVVRRQLTLTEARQNRSLPDGPPP